MSKETSHTPQGWEYFQNLKNVWGIMKVNLMGKYTQLTEEDLNYEEGKEEELLQRIQRRLGKSKEEVERLLQDVALSEPPKSNTETPQKN